MEIPPNENPSPDQIQEIDDELAQLEQMTAGQKTHEEAVESGTMDDTAGERTGVGTEDDDELVRRSIYVGNVDYGATPQELQEHFKRCGKVYRVTIMNDKYTGRPKGFAYIEFGDKAAAENALMLANTTLRGRQIKVSPKRKNIAGLSRGFRGRRARGLPQAMYGAMYGMPGMFPYGGPRRGRGRGAAAPNPY